MLRSLLRTAIHHYYRRRPSIPLTFMGIMTDRNPAPDVPDIENLPQSDGGPTRKEEQEKEEEETRDADEPAWAAAHRNALKVGS